jgi:hypothetical protein
MQGVTTIDLDIEKSVFQGAVAQAWREALAAAASTSRVKRADVAADQLKRSSETRWTESSPGVSIVLSNLTEANGRPGAARDVFRQGAD